MSSLKKKFSQETNIVEKIKVFIRSKVHVEKKKIHVKEHRDELRVSCTQ